MKRSLSLIEVLISFTLLAVLLSSLFGWYSHLTKSRMELKESEWPLLEQRYCHQRLDKIFGSCSTPFFTSDERLSNLEKGSLVFHFERGITKTPELCGKALGRLYFDPEDKRLYLGVWPLEGQEPSETYVLLTDVDTFQASFYQAPNFEMPIQQPSAGWHTRWGGDQLPALIRLDVKRFGEEQTFAFDLGHPIRYPRSHA